MRLTLVALIGVLCLAYAFALEDNGHHLEDLLGVADQGDAHAEAGLRVARGYGGHYGGGHGGHYGGGYGGHYGGGHHRGGHAHYGGGRGGHYGGGHGGRYGGGHHGGGHYGGHHKYYGH
ncbi:hypothetical protein KR032_001903 [Drosophila birchii]|nr:hypothetical protein KR032_001903 [Drosophila birchii]